MKSERLTLCVPFAYFCMVFARRAFRASRHDRSRWPQQPRSPWAKQAECVCPKYTQTYHYNSTLYAMFVFWVWLLGVFSFEASSFLTYAVSQLDILYNCLSMCFLSVLFCGWIVWPPCRFRLCPASAQTPQAAPFDCKCNILLYVRSNLSLGLVFIIGCANRG